MKLFVLTMLTLVLAGTGPLEARTDNSKPRTKAAEKRVEAKREAARESAPRRSGDPSNLITLSPEIFLNSNSSSYGATLGYERPLGPGNLLAQLLVQTSGPSSANLTTIGLAGGYRYYLIPQGTFKGVFVAPKLMVGQATYTYETTVSTVTLVGFTPVTTFKKENRTLTSTLVKFGAEAGYQTQVWNSIYAGGVIDLGYTAVSTSTTGGPALGLDGLGLGSSFFVGFAF